MAHGGLGGPQGRMGGPQRPRGAHKGPAHKGASARAQGGPQEPRGAHKGPARKGPGGSQGPRGGHEGPVHKGLARKGPGGPTRCELCQLNDPTFESPFDLSKHRGVALRKVPTPPVFFCFFVFVDCHFTNLLILLVRQQCKLTMCALTWIDCRA